MTTKTVLSVGQCRPDNAAISHFLTSNFDIRFLTCDSGDDALAIVQEGKVDLVLVNRKLDADGSDGLAIIASITQNATMPAIPVMLISNYEEWQQKATSIGARPGFGKAELRSGVAKQRVDSALSS